HEKLREHAAGRVDLRETPLVDLHVLGLGFAAVDDPGDHALLAQPEGVALARVGARFGAQFLHLAHGGIPWISGQNYVLWPGKPRLLAEWPAQDNRGPVH